MKIPPGTRTSAIKQGYDIRIKGIQYEVVHITSKQVVASSETSAKDALNQAFGTRRTATFLPEGRKNPYGKISRALRDHVLIDDRTVCHDSFNDVCIANDIKPGRWKRLNGGLRMMAMINTLSGLVRGSRGREPRIITIGTVVIRPGEDLK